MNRGLILGGFAFAAVSFVAPASADEWKANWEPSQFADGSPYCMIWFGEQRPMMNFTIAEDFSLLAVGDDRFADLEGMLDAVLNLPSGVSGLRVDVSAAPAVNGVRLMLSEQDLDTLLFDFAAGGTFTFEVAGTSNSFPTTGFAGLIDTVQACRAVLAR
ncbi:hypothetical protein [Pelagibacterium montanilacus]|uniref:hypothetical protein n=1 Tax=Pelagibacterium montanilacus TaxID=2185280 RepID=UPI000F8E434F|nr:hypothetical protein [Pelagibacterium montanilacus]